MPFSIVEFQDPTGEIIVARVPPEGTGEFITGSQLIVQDGQLAVFYRDGRPADAFKAGRYTLDTRTLPILSKFLKLASFGRKAPFRAYVYFVALRTFTNLGWGTATPILFRDQEFKAVHLRANGTFSLRIKNPKTFLFSLVGTRGLETTYAVEDFVRRVIVSSLAKTLPGIMKTVLDLASHYQDIEVSLKRSVYDDLNQYGIELVDLLVEAITVPPEVRAMIDRAAGSRAVDELEIRRYQILAASDALRDASKQPGGGMTDAVGLGAGFGMAQQFVAGMGEPRTPAAGGPPPPPPPSATAQWYTAVGGQQAGPFTQEDIQAQIQKGQIGRDTHVWRQGMANWAPAGQVSELSAFFGGVSPPPPPAPSA